MKATRFCLSVVRRGVPATSPVLGEDVGEISDFLASHADSLLKRASAGTAPGSVFPDEDRRALFEALRSGSDGEFLAGAGELAVDLVNQMGHVNSKDGVLVCATFENQGNTLSAALKLQVVSDHGAVLAQLATGETVLSAVKQVLDRPGELQKGIVYPDSRDGSEAVVGDKANQIEARYFLLAMGVRTEEHMKRALGAVATTLVDVVRLEDRPAVLRQLTSAAPGSVDDVVAAATAGLTLSRPVEEVIKELVARERPIGVVNTQAPLKATIVAGSITIQLNSADLSRHLGPRSCRRLDDHCPRGR
ncbi:MAG TPA: hypothetical protein VIU11_14695 [Nakamurella sp.]